MSAPRKSVALAVQACRSAFQTTITVKDDKWKLRQFYGLHQLLLHFREEFLAALAEEYNHSRASYERELALVLQDIARHYFNVTNTSTTPTRRTSSATNYIRCLPVGVSLILTRSVNPFRYALAPLVASIAAGNTVVLATESTNSRFFTLLHERIGKYLDSQSIHIIQGVDPHEVSLTQANHLFVIDERPDRYSEILLRQDARFHSTWSAVTLAVVDDGSKKLQEVTEEIHRNQVLAHGLAPERLTAVFIREENAQGLASAFDKLGDHQFGSNIDSEELKMLGFKPFTAGAYQCKLSRLVKRSADSKMLLSPAFDAARKSEVLLVLVYTSLEQVMDALSALDNIPLQVALLAPGSKSSAQYFEQWTRSRVFSIGRISSIIPQAIPLCGHVSPQNSETLFPSASFGVVRMIVSGKHHDVPSLLSIQIKNEKVVKAVAPDPNQTMEFFSYMTRVLTCVGVVLGGLAVAGLYIRCFH